MGVGLMRWSSRQFLPMATLPWPLSSWGYKITDVPGVAGTPPGTCSQGAVPGTFGYCNRVTRVEFRDCNQVRGVVI